MANALYSSARNSFLKGSIDWVNDSFKVILLSSAYSVDLANHVYTSSVGGTVANSNAITTLTPSSGIADASDITFSGVAGTTATQFVLFKDSTKELVAYFDTGTNLPIVPNGGDITIQWDDGANKIFKL